MNDEEAFDYRLARYRDAVWCLAYCRQVAESPGACEIERHLLSTFAQQVKELEELLAAHARTLRIQLPVIQSPTMRIQ